MIRSRSLLSFLSAVLIPVLAAAVISCSAGKSSVRNNTGESAEPDYSGIYKLSDDQVCDIVIAIKKSDGGYAYSISGTGVKSSGKLSVVKDGEETYLVFSNTLRDGDKTAVEGGYSDGKIMIQNSGNAMNQYICFKQCDVKYLEFERE